MREMMLILIVAIILIALSYAVSRSLEKELLGLEKH